MRKNSLNYPAELVDDVFGANETLAKTLGSHRFIIVADQNVVSHVDSIGKRIGAYVQTYELKLAGSPVVLAGGERIKMDDFRSAMRVLDALYASELEDGDLVLALGGGTLLDVVGWVAAQYPAQIGVIRVPTTPSAMFGTAFAETAALNTPRVKDALVVPAAPAAVLLDPKFAMSVLDGVWRAGVSDLIRLAAVFEPETLEEIDAKISAYANRDQSALSAFVELALRLHKKGGYTALGLASSAPYEPRSAWKLPHGYAVAIGTIIDLEEPLRTRAHSILKACGAMDGARHSKHILPPELSDFW